MIRIEINATHPDDLKQDIAILAQMLNPKPVVVGNAASVPTLEAPTDTSATDEKPVEETKPAAKKSAARSAKAKNAAPAAEEPKPQISANHENRVDPAEAAQDEADEAAEQEAATAEEPKKLTLDDVRAAATPYIQKFGMDAAQSDLMACLKDATGKYSKMSELPADDQDVLAKAVAAFEAAGEAASRYGK